MHMQALPDERGHFGPFGGRFVPETVMPALVQLEAAYRDLKDHAPFKEELRQLWRDYSGRPTPLYRADNLSRHTGGGTVYLKREDLNHTGAHKINNTLGQVLLARYMGKRRVIAETGAGQHGVATAAVAARFGMECCIFMGEEDVQRQALNVYRMRLLGARVEVVTAGTRTLKDATTAAIQDWVTRVEDTHYIIGSVVGPHPYPLLVRDFQAIIGRETRDQVLQVEGCLPQRLVACVGGGSNALGMFYPFLDDAAVELVGVEAAGEGLDTPHHAATLGQGRPGVLHGAMSMLLQDGQGQVLPAHSISAGLDYPGVGPEHAYLQQCQRARYAAVEDGQALEAFQRLSQTEGIIPALESAHALALLLRPEEHLAPGTIQVLCLSGRGDKDVEWVSRHLEVSPSCLE